MSGVNFLGQFRAHLGVSRGAARWAWIGGVTTPCSRSPPDYWSCAPSHWWAVSTDGLAGRATGCWLSMNKPPCRQLGQPTAARSLRRHAHRLARCAGGAGSPSRCPSGRRGRLAWDLFASRADAARPSCVSGDSAAAARSRPEVGRGDACKRQVWRDVSGLVT